jgi:hypothetical protein
MAIDEYIKNACEQGATIVLLNPPNKFETLQEILTKA